MVINLGEQQTPPAPPPPSPASPASHTSIAGGSHAQLTLRHLAQEDQSPHWTDSVTLSPPPSIPRPLPGNAERRGPAEPPLCLGVCCHHLATRELFFLLGQVFVPTVPAAAPSCARARVPAPVPEYRRHPPIFHLQTLRPRCAPDPR